MLCQEGQGTVFSGDVKASGCGSASPSEVGAACAGLSCLLILPFPFHGGGGGLVPIFFVGRHGP